MRIYKLFVINWIKRLIDKKTHTFFKTIPLYLPSSFSVPRCELPQIKKNGNETGTSPNLRS